MNDQGLFWDGFSAPYLEITKGEDKIPILDRQYFFNATLAENCSTVNDVVDLLDSHDIRDFGYERLQILFVDRFGNSMIFEGDEYVFKEGDYQAVTNFYQTHPELGGYGFDRYDTAIDMLENMDDFSMKYFRDICDATHQNWNPYPKTIYSLVCDLTQNVIHYYYQYNYEDVWEINLNELFEYGIQTYDVLDVFNNHEPSKPNKPVGPNTCDEYSIQEYSCQATDIDGDKLYYKWDFGDGTISNWIGPFNSGETCVQSHQWIDGGEYQVKVRVRDESCGKSEWSDPLEVQVTDLNNSRPDKPITPSGPSNGKSGEEYTYTTSTTDPDDDKVYYMWDWGDGTFSDWIGPYNSGEECSASHIWNDRASYSIKVKAKDENGIHGPWSDPLSVSMPKSKVIDRPILNFLEQHPRLFPILRVFLKLAKYQFHT
jgi:hypothetical protein